MYTRDINHVFYRFEYPVNENFTEVNFNEGLALIPDYRLNYDDERNLECTGISYLSSFNAVASSSLSNENKELLFFGRFVKGKYGDQIHLYSKTGDFSDIEEDVDFIGRESDKTPDEMVVKDFYYIFKIWFNVQSRTIEGVISKPTLIECMGKNELGFIVKSIIQNNFSHLDDAGDVTFSLSEILGEQQLNNFSEKGLTISYVETKTVSTLMSDLEQDIDGYDDADCIDVTVSINKTNSSKIKDLIRRFTPSRVVDSPIKRLVIRNDYGKLINLEEFCYNFKINDIEIQDGIIFGDSKAYYFEETSKFIVNKIIPNIFLGKK